MNDSKMNRALGLIDDELILEAKEDSKSIKINYRRWVPLCACFIFLLTFFVIKSSEDYSLMCGKEAADRKYVSNESANISYSGNQDIYIPTEYEILKDEIEGKMDSGELPFVSSVYIDYESEKIALYVVINEDTEENRDLIKSFETNDVEIEIIVED